MIEPGSASMKLSVISRLNHLDERDYRPIPKSAGRPAAGCIRAADGLRWILHQIHHVELHPVQTGRQDHTGCADPHSRQYQRNQIMRDCRRQVAKKAHVPVVEVKWAFSETIKEHIRQETWNRINDQIPFGAYAAIYSRFIQY